MLSRVSFANRFFYPLKNITIINKVNQQRFYKLPANQIRNGLVIEFKNKYVEVVQVHMTQNAQRGTTISCDLKDITTGQKFSNKWRTSDTVEAVDLESKNLEFIELDGKEFVFRDTIDYDTFNLDEKFVRDVKTWLKPGSKLQLRLVNGEPISIRFRKNVQIAKVKNSNLSTKVNDSRKRVLLENGEKIMTPLHIVDGDLIKVNIETKEFIQRCEATEDIEEDEEE